MSILSWKEKEQVLVVENIVVPGAARLGLLHAILDPSVDNVVSLHLVLESWV